MASKRTRGGGFELEVGIDHASLDAALNKAGQQVVSAVKSIEQKGRININGVTDLGSDVADSTRADRIQSRYKKALTMAGRRIESHAVSGAIRQQLAASGYDPDTIIGVDRAEQARRAKRNALDMQVAEAEDKYAKWEAQPKTGKGRVLSAIGKKLGMGEEAADGIAHNLEAGNLKGAIGAIGPVAAKSIAVAAVAALAVAGATQMANIVDVARRAGDVARYSRRFETAFTGGGTDSIARMVGGLDFKQGIMGSLNSIPLLGRVIGGYDKLTGMSYSLEVAKERAEQMAAAHQQAGAVRNELWGRELAVTSSDPRAITGQSQAVQIAERKKALIKAGIERDDYEKSKTDVIGGAAGPAPDDVKWKALQERYKEERDLYRRMEKSQKSEMAVSKQQWAAMLAGTEGDIASSALSAYGTKKLLAGQDSFGALGADLAGQYAILAARQKGELTNLHGPARDLKLIEQEKSRSAFMIQGDLQVRNYVAGATPTVLANASEGRGWWTPPAKPGSAETLMRGATESGEIAPLLREIAGMIQTAISAGPNMQ